MSPTGGHRSSRRPATDDEARALASTVRLRILRICLGEARTNREIADALGRDPGSVLHHVRTLTDTGFLTALEPRRGTRGAREIPYLATGKSWTVETPGKDAHLVAAFVEEAALVPAESMHTMRMGLRMTPDERAEFEGRLEDLVEEFRARTDPRNEGDAWSLFFAVHPDPNRPPGTPSP
ncbi:transcriptional regulator [Jatrophihabitans endophyticus]|uniref:ArsR/SmtB family transcription factor n=1 Tax=Jatrophihabitans endophyticus TaxID=1206085 RepID=UPI0019E2F692|nr:winged helix-turn-helix domain-containing protein [Jatrophihabitans endophyticus]MBE7188470.1 winged helix-turn-helix transcriptional regulator [Jatrophihabitans endophyticus]